MSVCWPIRPSISRFRELEVNVASNPNILHTMVKSSAFTSIVTNWRKSVARAALAIGVALGFASPAQAETVTLSCDGEMFVDGASAPRSWTVDIDLAFRPKWRAS